MRWYHKFLALAGVISAVLLFIFFGLKIDTVKVEGTQAYSDEEIRQAVFTRRFSDNELFFEIYRKIYGINKLPLIEDIEVTYENMHTVLLHVYDKAISGCIRYMGQYVYFDKDGIVLQSTEEKKEGVPVVTGIQFGTFTVGEAFNVKDNSLFAAIMNLSQLIAHYGIEVNRIHVTDGAVALYSGDILVMLGKKEMYDDEMSALSSVLETTKKERLSGTIHMENFREGDKIILKSKMEKKKKKAKKEG